MKKFYFLCLFLSFTLVINAQVSVTFAVDMNTQIDDGTFVVGTDKMRIGGDFQGWTPTDNEMLDADENGVYSLTVDLMDGQELLFKYVINDWGTNEFGMGAVAGDCNVDDGAGNVNRTHIVADNNGTDAITIYVYDTCDESANGITNTNEISTIQDVKITPNPTSGLSVVTFANPNNANHNIMIASLTGQVVQQFQNITDSNLEINTQDLAAGVYFVTFQNELGEVGSEKLIVQ